jgi:hypothetical protein
LQQPRTRNCQGFGVADFKGKAFLLNSPWDLTVAFDFGGFTKEPFEFTIYAGSETLGERQLNDSNDWKGVEATLNVAAGLDFRSKAVINSIKVLANGKDGKNSMVIPLYKPIVQDRVIAFRMNFNVTQANTSEKDSSAKMFSIWINEDFMNGDLWEMILSWKDWKFGKEKCYLGFSVFTVADSELMLRINGVRMNSDKKAIVMKEPAQGQNPFHSTTATENEQANVEANQSFYSPKQKKMKCKVQ